MSQQIVPSTVLRPPQAAHFLGRSRSQLAKMRSGVQLPEWPGKTQSPAQ
jgi:hypothetical protein